jgi:hypothetical protein
VQVVFFWHDCSHTHTHEAGQLTRFDSSCAVLLLWGIQVLGEGDAGQAGGVGGARSEWQCGLSMQTVPIRYFQSI